MGGLNSLPLPFYYLNIMNIWEAYQKPAYYNIYFDLLVAKGMKREKAENLKQHFTTYLYRIKETIFARQLKECEDPQSFKAKLHEIFYDKWSGKLKYEEMPDHYEAYLSFLDSMQALYNDFINNLERTRLISSNPEIPVKELSHYETEYLKDGKLVALMNPQLIFILKDYIENEQIRPARVAMLCSRFYGDLLPQMKAEDFVPLIKTLWNEGRKIKKGGKRNQLKITFPNGEEKTLTFFEAAKVIVLYYGVEEIKKRKFEMRGQSFIVNYIPMGKEKFYKEIDYKVYMYAIGDAKGYMNLLRFINVINGKKLQLEMV